MKRVFAVFLVLALVFSGTCAYAADLSGDAAADAALSGEALAQVQERLIALGFLEGEADGKLGKHTQAALHTCKAALRKAGYSVSQGDSPDQETLQLLNDEAVCEKLSTLAPGDTGTAVEKMQGRLEELGFLLAMPDGEFGHSTAAALEAFQAALIENGVAGVTVSGRLDKATRESLYSDLSGFTFATPPFFDESAPRSLDDRYLYSKACVLVDAATGEVLYAKNADERMYPASTTKIMTLMLALQQKKLKRMITVPEAAAQVPADSSLVPVLPGEKMPFLDLLYGLMIHSGNDSANAIAALTAGSVDKFVQKMNQKAEALGMTHTHFTSPHGYHDKDHYTTATDMAKLTCAALKDDKFRAIISARQYTMAPTQNREALTLTNAYDILDSASPYYYPDAFGIKTGYTSFSGYCYVGAATRDGKTLVAVVLHCGSGGAKSDKWVDARRLFNYGFAQ
ncbi:MAG: peptidoglycan-binding protein [Clostridia bacterium]